MKNLRLLIFCLITFLCLTSSLVAQTKRNPRKPTEQPNTTVEPKSEEIPAERFSEPKISSKKNERPSNGNETKNASAMKSAEDPPVYFYEFSQPNFLVSKVLIEHDENGKGKITFEEKNFDEAVTDPIQLSPTTLEKIKNLWQTLNFLDSNEVYQSAERNYAHLGTVKVRMKKDERERNAEFNWTENSDAKALADEYRKIGQQFVWMFGIGVARENQPLETPRIMDTLDSLIRRDEISDPQQMLPFLKELTNDERLPLIARNHANRLIQQIEKQMAKKR